MITQVLFITLCVLSFVLVLHGLRRKEGCYEFQVLFAGAFAFSIIPQLVNHVYSEGRLPQQVYEDRGVEWGIVMCILCLLAGCWGSIRPLCGAGSLRAFIPATHPEKYWWAGVALCVIGTYGMVAVDQMAGGFRARFMQGGHYALETSGRVTIYMYLGKLSALGLVLCIISAIHQGTFLKWAFTALMLVYPIASVIFLGRRTAVVSLALVLGLSLWFYKRWAPPRLVSIAGLATCGLLVIFLPHYRDVANQTGNIREAVKQIQVEDVLEGYRTGERGEGMDNLIVGVAARMKDHSFSLGSVFWNGLVDFFVPAQIVGADFKQSLFLKIGKEDSDLFSEYCGYMMEFDSYLTGPYSVYREFWFFGCLLYYLMARFYKRLWRLANETQGSSAQILYMATLLFVPFSVVNSAQDCFARFTLAFGVLWVVLRLIGSKPQRGRAARGGKTDKAQI